MSKLEKFKRRLIRSVATLQLQEKKTEDELWEILRGEIGKNCKVLWERMRALTVKKLKRLLAAEDIIGRIPKFAQMSDTDWLLFDLIIAHEDEDVIGREEMYNKGANSKALTDLFTLVQRFNIEGERAEKLAEAWTAAARLYNSNNGRQCSPMLMQRRWYQLKQCTRQRFYDFWFSYRGTLRYWDEAQVVKPTELQQAIANKYPLVVTAPFLHWDELVNCRLVILSDEFERYKNKIDLPKPIDEKSPDLLLVEPVIETIDLEEYISDDEKCAEEKLSKLDKMMLSCDVKMEPEYTCTDIDFEDEQGFKSHISMEVMNSLEQEETLIDMTDHIGDLNKQVMDQEIAVNVEESDVLKTDISNTEQNVLQTTDTKPIPTATKPIPTATKPMPTETKPIQTDTKPIPTDIPLVEKNTASEVTSVTTVDSIEQDNPKVANEDFQQYISDSFEEGIPKITNVFSNVDITNEDIINNLINNLREDAKNITGKPDVTIVTKSENETVCETINLDDSLDTDEDHVKHETTSLPENNKEAVVKISSPISLDSTASKISKDKNENEDTTKTSKDSNGNDDSAKIKQSLFGGLRNYFDVTEGVIELVDDGIEYVEDDELEDNTDIHTPFKIETEDNEDSSDSEEPKFDLKLLMQTTVYTTKLDDMIVLKDKSFNSIKDQSLIDSVIIESKPVCFKSLHVPDYMNTDNSINTDILPEDDTNEVDDIELVELSSNLLKKPRNRSYNPIILCKNPDFNTRLKRLTVGFLSSSRNRFLLKLCKPMTIDISKGFESKLVNGTMYLKYSDTKVDFKNYDNDNNTSSVIPSAMSVQSLIDNMVLQTLSPDLQNKDKPSLVISIDGSLAEKNKSVNVTNTSEIRVVNNQLLTPGVIPYQIQNFNLMTDNLSGNLTNQNINTAANLSNCDIIELEPQPKISGDQGQILRDSLVENKEGCTNTPDNIISSGSSSSIPTDITNKTYKIKNLGNFKPTPWRFNYPSGKVAVSWLKNIKYNKDDGALITIDTLQKMLSHINGTSDVQAPVKDKSKKKKKLKTYKNQESKPKETANNTLVKTKDKHKIQPVNVTDNLKNPKVTVMFAKNEKYYKTLECCWARSRINLKLTKLKRFCIKHTCKRNRCSCCCKNELRNLVNSIKSDKALKRACDSIESVVQQTRELIEVQTSPTIKPSVSVTLAEQSQIYTVDLSEDLSDTEISPNPKHVSTTVDSDSNKDSYIDIIETNNHKVTHIEKKDTSTSMEIDKLNPVKEVSPNFLSQSTIVTNYNSKIHNAEKLKSVETNQILASAVQPDRSYNNILSKQNLSIDDKTNSQQTVKMSCQQLNSQTKDIGTSDNIKIKPIINIQNSKDKILILNRRQLSEDKTKSPIYLGKHKILVTNIRIPRHVLANEQTPKPLSDTTIPKGVQLTLSPTGELMYNLQPGVEIDNDCLSRLPSIMSAVQSHLNTVTEPSQKKIIVSGINNEVVLDVCENDSEPLKEINVESSQFLSSEFIAEESHNDDSRTNIAHDPLSQKIVNFEQGKLTCKEQASEVSTYNEQVLVKTDKCEINESNPTSQLTTVVSENLQPPIIVEHILDESSETKQEINRKIESSEENLTKTTDCDDTFSKNRKTLLSDLMEMSGISAEDVAPTENMLEETVEIPQLVSLTSQSDDCTVPMINIPMKELEGTNRLLSLPHLSMISSYSEIKYAYENNGSFFKLDYKTGILAPITVCLKKSERSPDISSGGVIDLTDEKDNTLEDQEKKTQRNKSSKRRLIPKFVLAKPLKVFKANHRPIILRKHKTLCSETNTMKPTENSLLKASVYERKIKLKSTKQIGIVNDSDDENTQRKRRYVSDSSDDEPLICKVKRKNNHTVNKTNENEINFVEMNEQSTEIREPCTDVIPGELELVKEFPENDIIKDDVDMSTTLSILYDNNDLEEDCILGV